MIDCRSEGICNRIDRLEAVLRDQTDQPSKVDQTQQNQNQVEQKQKRE